MLNLWHNFNKKDFHKENFHKKGHAMTCLFFIFLCFMVLNRLNRQIDNMLSKHAKLSLPTPIPLNNLPQTNKSPQSHHCQAYDDDETQS